MNISSLEQQQSQGLDTPPQGRLEGNKASGYTKPRATDQSEDSISRIQPTASCLLITAPLIEVEHRVRQFVPSHWCRHFTPLDWCCDERPSSGNQGNLTDNTLRSPLPAQQMTHTAMLITAIAWTLLPQTLQCQTALFLDKSVINLMKTVRNLILAITWLSC